MKYRLISADGHIDINWLPHDLFTSQAPADLKDRMPYVIEGDDGPTWVTKKGVVFGLSKGIGPTGRKFVPGQFARVDVMETRGLWTDGIKGIPRTTDPDMRAQDLASDGIDAEVIFGLLGVASRMQDDEAAYAVTRIYNDWLKDFCSRHPERHIGLAVLPAHDIDLAVKEVHRAAGLGLRGLEMPISHEIQYPAHPKWEPLWKAASEVDLPLHFHTAPQVPWGFRKNFPGSAAESVAFQTTAVFQMTLGNLISGIIGSGAFDRYPNLRIGFAECGTGWIPYLLDRMDFLYKDAYHKSLPIKMLPSEYWRRHCRATFQFDPIGGRLIDVLGEETLMWGADFPHLDGVWPESKKYIDEQFAGVPPDVVRKITCENAARFYRLD